MRRNTTCVNCGSQVSLSNIARHQASKSCANGGKGLTRPEMFPWATWKTGEDQYRLPCGYEGNKIACRNYLTNREVMGKGGQGNLSGYVQRVKSGDASVHNKGSVTSEDQKRKVSATLKKYYEVHGGTRFTPERRARFSEVRKKYLQENPHKHPNALVAGNRAKMTYPEQVADEWFKEKGIDAAHNKKVGKFFPDFVVGKIIVELDGQRWHSSPSQQTSDKVRDGVLREAGYEVWRIPAKDNIRKRLEEIFKNRLQSPSSI